MSARMGYARRLLAEPPFLQFLIHGIGSPAWVHGQLSLEAIDCAVRVFEDGRNQFSYHVAPLDWIRLARIVWMCSQLPMSIAAWRLTRRALNTGGLGNLARQMQGGATYQYAIDEIEKLYDSAMEESLSVPPLISQPPITMSSLLSGDETESEGKAAAEVGAKQAQAQKQEQEREHKHEHEQQQDTEEDDDDDHVIEADGMRRIKESHLALALRAHTATRGANDDELKRNDLAFECPYFCKPGGGATIIERANNLTRHMQREHNRPRGFRVTNVDTTGNQYQMAGSGGAEVVWKLVQRL